MLRKSQTCPCHSINFPARRPKEVTKLYLFFVALVTLVVKKAEVEREGMKDTLEALLRDDSSPGSFRLESAPALGQGWLQPLQCLEPNSASRP